MPSHKIHISIANEINKKLKLDADKVLIGSVLPDLSNSKHYISHFNTDKNDHVFYNKELFLSKYDIHNPVLTGYLIHLLTDEFYNRYVRDNYFIIEDNKLCGVKLLSGNYYCSSYDAMDIKQEDFHVYDEYLINTKEFPIINYISNIPKIDECNYSIDYIKEYIDNYNLEISKEYNSDLKYKYLTSDIADKIYNECIEYILNYLNNHLKN